MLRKGDGLLVHEPEMGVVEKVFRHAAQGLGPRAIRNRLYSEGIPAPKGGNVWDDRVIRWLLANDLYRPHTFEEVAELVTSEVAARLDPDERYGIHWFNRKKTGRRTVKEPDASGGWRYRKRSTVALRPKEEWIAVPVPAYLSLALVDRACTTLENNKGYERKHLARGWELRGLLRCRCGSKMRTHTTQPGRRRMYHYYTCLRRRSLGKMCSCTQKSLRAAAVEPVVWAFVSDLLEEPDRLRVGMEALIEQERMTGPNDSAEKAELWTQKIAECSHLRKAYQDQQAAGLMTLEELRGRLEELETTRRLAQTELEALAEREARVKELEEDRDALLEGRTEMVPGALNTLTGEERNKLYRMLRLEVTPSDEGYEVSGAICTSGLPSG